MKYTKYLIGIIILTAFLLIVVTWQVNTITGMVANADKNLLQIGQDANKITQLLSQKGSPDAPVTIIEYSDFECGFCRKFYKDTYSLIEKEYIETGKAKIIFRDFPLTTIHPNSQKAAEAGKCALEQGRFWDMHDILFEKGVSGGVAAFKSYAEELGLDTEKFNTCLDTGKMARLVKEDFEEGKSLGIRGTPAFLINGNLVSGAQPITAFREKIDSAQ